MLTKIFEIADCKTGGGKMIVLTMKKLLATVGAGFYLLTDLSQGFPRLSIPRGAGKQRTGA